MKVYINTFGCTFNQADSQIMAGLLKENTGSLTDSPEDADVIIDEAVKKIDDGN